MNTYESSPTLHVADPDGEERVGGGESLGETGNTGVCYPTKREVTTQQARCVHRKTRQIVTYSASKVVHAHEQVIEIGLH